MDPKRQADKEAWITLKCEFTTGLATLVGALYLKAHIAWYGDNSPGV